MFQYNEVHVHVFFASANFRKFVDAKKEAYVHPSIVFLYDSVRTHRILTVQCRLVPENGYGTKQYRSNELFVPVPSIQYNTVHYTVSFTVGKSILKNIPITKKNSKIPEFYDFLPYIMYGSITYCFFYLRPLTIHFIAAYIDHKFSTFQIRRAFKFFKF